MVKQAAFTGERKLLKGALHCHTTRSDGRGSPEDVIRLHAANGFNFMAVTDHRLYNYKNYAPDVPMTIIPGMEIDANFPEKGCHCFHVVSIGPAKDNGNGFEQDQVFPSYSVSGQADMQPVLDMLHANGNLTFYCHPEWSGTPTRDFEELKGNFGLEIWNSGCALEHGLDTNNGTYWDELLMQGKRVSGLATDDGHPMSHHANGWVMVNSDNDIQSILNALECGAFYASCGPEIYDFTADNGVATLKCSPVKKIWFRYGRYPQRQYVADGELLTEAEYAYPNYFTYLRAIVMDEHGRRAWTNPIYLDGR